MEQNSSKKVLLSVLGVAILIVAVVGISFAALNYDRTGGTNTITTGTITMSFTEATNGILLENALPMGDSTAIKTLTGSREYFDFSVTSTANAAVNVGYEVNVTPVAITETETVGALTAGEVKIYLEEKNAEGNYVAVVDPVLVSSLTGSTLRAGSLVLDDFTDEYTATTGGTNTRDFRLRIWVDSNVNTDKLSAKRFDYKILVNVDSRVNAIGATEFTPGA